MMAFNCEPRATAPAASAHQIARTTFAANITAQFQAPVCQASTIADPANSELDSAWQAAVRAERVARSSMERYEGEVSLPIDRAYQAGNAPFEDAFDAEEEEWSYTSLHSAAVDALIMTPAPDLACVATKIDLGLANDAFQGRDEADSLLRAIADDIRRLAIGVA